MDAKGDSTHGAAQPGRLKSATGMRHTVLATLACTGCIVTTPTLVMVNNHIMRKLRFNYPLLVTSMGMGFVMCATRTMRSLGILRPVPMPWQFYLRKIVPLGGLAACTFVTGNASYLFLSISLVQVIKCLTPVFTLLVTSWVQPTAVSTGEGLAVLLMTLGGMWAVCSSLGHSSWGGIILMVGSDMCEAVRSVTQQQLLQFSSLSLLELLFWFSPVAFACLLLAALVEEVPRAVRYGDFSICLANPGAFFLGATLGFMSNCFIFAAIQLTSALKLKVLTTISSIALIYISAVVHGDILTSHQITGYAVSMVGFVWYNVAKVNTSNADRKKLVRNSGRSMAL